MNRPHLLTQDQVDSLCLFGAGEKCCSFLMNGPGGWACAKGTDFEALLQARRNAGTIRARGDNCAGPPGFEPKESRP